MKHGGIATGGIEEIENQAKVLHESMYGAASTSNNALYAATILGIQKDDQANGDIIAVKPAATSTGAITLAVTGGTARGVYYGDDPATQLGAGDWVINKTYVLVYNSSIPGWECLNCSTMKPREVAGATSNNALYTGTVPGLVTANQLVNGYPVLVKPAATSTGSITFNPSALGAGAVYDASDNTKQLGAGDWVQNGMYLLVYNTTLSGWVCYGIRPYTPTAGWAGGSNVTATRAFDANATTIEELADVLGTLISDLKAQAKHPIITA